VELTVLEHKAFDALNALGADLDDAFTPETLRRAFRKLAHRYHPDRHSGSSAAERARLARLFAEATDHYRLLTRRS
jgi:DnaJ-class molecular chaperone